MLDFTDQTPYEILSVSENTYAPIIERQLRHKISLYCALDKYATDIHGNNLRELFQNAAQTLLDPELRKQLDLRLKQERQLITIINNMLSNITLQLTKEEQLKYLVLKPNGTLYLSEARSQIENEITIRADKINISPYTDLENLLKQLNLLIIQNPDIIKDIFPSKEQVLKKKA